MAERESRRAVPIRDQVYGNLRQEILSGVLEPGARIVEEEICKRYHVSRTPVRESLRKLENEKLLVHVPNKGAVVAAWSVKDVEEIFRLRVCLEKLVVSVVSEKMNSTNRKKLESTAFHLQQIIQGKKVEQNLLFEDFHPILHEIADMPRLKNMVEGLQDYLHRVHHLLRRNPERRKEAYKGHYKIAMALLKGDVVEAEKQMEEHLNSGYEFFLKQIEMLPKEHIVKKHIKDIASS